MRMPSRTIQFNKYLLSTLLGIYEMTPTCLLFLGNSPLATFPANRLPPLLKSRGAGLCNSLVPRTKFERVLWICLLVCLPVDLSVDTCLRCPMNKGVRASARPSVRKRTFLRIG